MSTFAVSLPILTVSEANAHEPFWCRHKRTKEQHRIVYLCCAREIEGRGRPARVKFTRIGKRDLDWQDNLNASFKHVRDAIAKLCGFNDRDRLVKWEYDQRRPKPGEAVGTRLEIDWDDDAPDMVKPELKKRLQVASGQGKLFGC